MTRLAPILQSFFTDYLISQRGASGHTVSAYRDTFRLLLGYVHERTGVRPNDLDLTVLDAGLVAEFLTMLEQRRGNSTRTRNARLAAIHSLFHHACLRHPEHAELIARVLAIPTKNTQQAVLDYLTDTEVDALLASPNRATWTGQRDHLFLLIMVSSGIRVSELTALTRADVCLDRHSAYLAVHGKGRKDRLVPLNTTTAKTLRLWLRSNPTAPGDPLLAARGTTRKLSRDAVAQRVSVHAAAASATCPSLASKTVTPHILRHTCAMRMRAAGCDTTTIGLWLGHESPESSRPYLHADLQLKQRTLERTAPPATKPGRYIATDKLLTFLEAL